MAHVLMLGDDGGWPHVLSGEGCLQEVGGLDACKPHLPSDATRQGGLRPLSGRCRLVPATARLHRLEDRVELVRVQRDSAPQLSGKLLFLVSPPGSSASLL